MVARASAELLETMGSDGGARLEVRGEVMPWPELVCTVRRQMGSLVGPGHRELEDLTQAALERVVEALPRFEGRAQLTTFTYRVCAHVAMSHWRGWRRWARRFQFWTDAAFDEPAPDDVGKAWIEAERARRLHRCIERLSPTKRACLTLVDLEDLPASRVAEIVGCPEPTVRSRLRSARAELARMLRRDPLFAIALGVIVWIAATARDPVAPPAPVEQDAPEVASVVEEEGPARVVARSCDTCIPRLVQGDRLTAGARVTVPAGTVLVLGFALEEGDELEVTGPANVSVDATGLSVERPKAQGASPPASPQAAAPEEEDPGVEWRRAQAALDSGDRRAAEHLLRALLAGRRADVRLRARASFSLGELELARGAMADARARLEPLLETNDVSLGADAAFLLARASGSARERAAVYARYLAHDPPSPYRELATVDEALALLDAGDTSGARSLAERLRTLPRLPAVVAPGVARLERRLGP
jgi:RNA polymerase sigma factor (sigma-70 family)